MSPVRAIIRALGWMRGLPGFIPSSIVFAVALVSRLYGLDSRSLWMDEASQAHKVLEGGFSLDIIQRAAAQQQPPIDYFAQYIGFQLFGVTPFGARVHAALFGALTVLCFYRLTRRIFEQRAPVIFGTALAFLHPTLVYYSQEARPIACGVFFSTLFLSNLHGFMMLPGVPWRRALRGLGLFASTWAFLLSVGMQPSVMLAASSLALVPALFSRALRFRVLGAGAIFVAAFALALPVLLTVIGRSKRFVQEEGSLSSDRLKSFAGELAEVPFAAWQTEIGTLIEPLWPPVIVLIVVGFLGFEQELRQRRRSAPWALTAFAALTTLIFPWLLDAIFAALVKYALKERYYATLTPVVLMLLTLLLHHAIPVVTRLAQHSRAAGFAAVACTIALVGWSAKLHGEATLEAYKEQKQDWASLYALFKRPQPPGISYLASLRELQHRDRPYIGQRFYYQGGKNRLVEVSRLEQLLDDFKGKRDLLVRGNVYFPVVEGWERIQPLAAAITERVPGATFHPLHGVSVIELRPTKQGKKALLPLFEVLVEGLKPTTNTWRFYNILVWLRFEEHDVEGAKEMAERLKALGSDELTHKGDEILREIKYRQKHRKQQRAKAAKKRADQ